MQNMSAAETQAVVSALLTRYVRCIDDNDLEAWPALFTETCHYFVTTRENVSRNLPIGMLECTSNAMLRDRVEALRRVNIYEPHVYRHHISGIEITIAGETVRARSNFLVTRTLVTGDTTIFAAGEYLDQIQFDQGIALFSERLVITDSRRIDTLLVLPL